MRYSKAYDEYTREPRTTTFNRAPRRTNHAQELSDRYSEYTLMGSSNPNCLYIFGSTARKEAIRRTPCL